MKKFINRLRKAFAIFFVSKRFYTKDQLEGIYWQGVFLGIMKHEAVEKITDKRLKEELQKYIQKLDELNVY